MVYRGSHFAARKIAPEIGDSRIDAFFARPWDLRRHDLIPDPALLIGTDVERDRDRSDRGVYLHLLKRNQYLEFLIVPEGHT
jgi:hypothetical protein